MEPEAYREMIELQESHWWYCARRKLLAHLMTKFVPVGQRVLEVGAGTGANLALLERWGAVTALEPNRFAADHLEYNYGVEVVRDAVPLATHSSLQAFDLVAALDVLEHIEDETAALEFMARKLRPGGWLVITVPAFQSLWSTHDEALHHKRRYRKEELARKLTDAGLAVEFRSYFNFLLFPLALAIRLADRWWSGAARSGTKRTPPLANGCLRFLFGLEAGLLPWFKPPFGLSVVALGRKPENAR